MSSSLSAPSPAVTPPSLTLRWTVLSSTRALLIWPVATDTTWRMAGIALDAGSATPSLALPSDAIAIEPSEDRTKVVAVR